MKGATSARLQRCVHTQAQRGCWKSSRWPHWVAQAEVLGAVGCRASPVPHAGGFPGNPFSNQVWVLRFENLIPTLPRWKMCLMLNHSIRLKRLPKAKQVLKHSPG